MDKSGLKRAAVFCILRSGSQYLMLKRNKLPFINRYAPVGGKVDPHETPREAVLREAFEESGIQLQPEDVTFRGMLTETSTSDYNWVSYIFSADIPFSIPNDCDEGTLEWVEYDNLKNIDIPPTDLPIYQSIEDNKVFVFSALYTPELKLEYMIDELTGKIVLSKE